MYIYNYFPSLERKKTGTSLLCLSLYIYQGKPIRRIYTKKFVYEEKDKKYDKTLYNFVFYQDITFNSKRCHGKNTQEQFTIKETYLCLLKHDQYKNLNRSYVLKAIYKECL